MTTETKTQFPRVVFERPRSLVDVKAHFCPGCHHGTIHRIVAECIDRYEVRENTIGVACEGCSVFLYDYIDVDVVEAPHGRAPAVATGVKRAQPDKFVFTYQGDGDLAAIGTSEVIHAANRGENLTGCVTTNLNRTSAAFLLRSRRRAPAPCRGGPVCRFTSRRGAPPRDAAPDDASTDHSPVETRAAPPAVGRPAGDTSVGLRHRHRRRPHHHLPPGEGHVGRSHGSA